MIDLQSVVSSKSQNFPQNIPTPGNCMKLLILYNDCFTRNLKFITFIIVLILLRMNPRIDIPFKLRMLISEINPK